MKRKRNQTEENHQSINYGKKFRFNEGLHSSEQNYDNSLDMSLESKKEEFVLTRDIAEHEVLSDISGKKWRIGVPIGKGSFGEIFLASDDIIKPVNVKNSNFVIKIEPHSNGPLFVEIHCLLHVNGKPSNEETCSNGSLAQILPNNVGIPKYIASGSHYFEDSRYRFLIMPRYKTDLHSIIKTGRLNQKHFLIVASQIIDVLMHLHGKNYVHSDIKAENIMIGLCKTESKPTKSKHSRKSFLNQHEILNASKKSRVQGLNFHSTVIKSHNLRPSKSIAYNVEEEYSRSSHGPDSDQHDNSEQDEDFEVSPKKLKPKKNSNPTKNKRNYSELPTKSFSQKTGKSLFCKPSSPKSSQTESDDDERVYVIDYGLATKFINTIGEKTVHKSFCCDERRAHDGTLEFTSRDAHFGAHSRRSDLECLGFNLIYWSQGFLPWKDEKLKEQPEIVHRLKEVFMTDVKEMLKLIYGSSSSIRYLGEFMQYVSNLNFEEQPDYKFLKGLFVKEFLKLGYKKSDMKLNMQEMREACEIRDKNLSENELMMSSIMDVKTARKLGFLIVTDCVDGNETQIKTNEIISLNISCKASPKNLRSKEKTKGKRPQRQPKVTEKELIVEKMAQGKKLTLGEIALIDPDQFARARAEREYERSDEKNRDHTSQKYQGNPTYAILEIQNKLKLRQSGSVMTSNVDVEPIKGYTKQMMDVLKKQQLMVEKQLSPCNRKRNRDGLKNVIKTTPRQISNKDSKIGKGKTTRKTKNNSPKRKCLKIEEATIDKKEVPLCDIVIDIGDDVDERPKVTRQKRGRTKLKICEQKLQTESDVHLSQLDNGEAANDVEEVQKPVKKKRGRPRIIKNIIEPPDTEEDSVYYDIPGEGSNDGVKDISEDENAPEIISGKQSSDESLYQQSQSVGTVSSRKKNKKSRSRYYADVDYDISTDETTNMSSVSNFSEKIQNTRKQRQGVNDGIITRNKVKSRSTSRSAVAFAEATDQSEGSDLSESEYEIQSGEDSGDDVQEIEYDQSGTEDEEDSLCDSDVADSNDSSNDSISVKYSPITKAKQNKNVRNLKNVRGRRINVINENNRNFRLVSTQG